MIKIDFEQTKPGKVSELYDAYTAKLYGGYTSSALGTAHTYSTTEEARNDLFGAAALGADVKFFCVDNATGDKVNPLHTAAQLIQIAGEFAAAKVALIEAFYANRALIEAALDQAGVDLALANGIDAINAVVTV